MIRDWSVILSAVTSTGPVGHILVISPKQHLSNVFQTVGRETDCAIYVLQGLAGRPARLAQCTITSEQATHIN